MAEISDRKAVNLAVHALEKEIQGLAFDASMFDHGYICPESQAAHDKRDELRQVVERIKALCLPIKS